MYFVGPSRNLLTTYFGENYSLASAQYSWCGVGQESCFYATVKRPIPGVKKISPRQAGIYYSRMFFDEDYPHNWNSPPADFFKEMGEPRVLQHKNTAMVFYNPIPRRRFMRNIRVGLFRPLHFNAPEELYVGEKKIPEYNVIWHQAERIAIRDGDVYLGIIPLMLNNNIQGRNALLQIHTYTGHLAILMSSFEDWAPREFSFEEILETNAGFICEMHSASDFSSFADFRQWLADAQVEDDYYLWMRNDYLPATGAEIALQILAISRRVFPPGGEWPSLAAADLRIENMPDPKVSLSD